MKSKSILTKGLSLLLALIMGISIVPMSAITASAATTPAKVDDATIKRRLDNLVSKLNNKYFTENQKYCFPAWNSEPNHGAEPHTNCRVGCVIKESWLKNLLLVPNNSSLLPDHYAIDYNKFAGANGWSCYGFANYAEWYIYAGKSTDKVSCTAVTKSCNFNYKDFKKYAKPGDIIRSQGGHSFILYSYNVNGIEVIDCNYARQTYGNCIVRKHSLEYGESWLGTKVSICRGSNYSAKVEAPKNAPTNLKVSGSGMLNNAIAVSSTVNLSWNSVSGATGYKVKLDGVQIQDKNVLSCSKVVNTVGKHEFEVIAYNSAGSSSGTKISFTTMADVQAIFYDENNVLIESKPTDWNTTPIEPANIPLKEHYEFRGWRPSLSNITTDTSYTAQYEKEKYKVRFFAYNNDGEAVQIGTTQTVKYLESATEPSNYLSYVKDGMEFAGWSCDFTSIEGNTDVYLIEKWYNDNMKIKILDGATALRDPDGYTVNCTLQNNYKDKTVGRIIVAVKTAEGKLIYTTESAAFTIKSGMKKSIEVYVPCEESGTVAEIFAVEKYTTALPISTSVKLTVDQGNAFTNWSTEKAPADALATETKTQYRYRDKETKLSGYDTLVGYERVGDKKLISTTYSDYYGNKANIVLNNRTDSNYTYIESQETSSKRASFAYVESKKKYYMPTSNSTYKDCLIVISDSFSTNANDNDGLGNYLRHYGVNGTGVLEKGKSVTTLGKIYAILWNGYDVSKYTTGANNKAIGLYDTKNRIGTKNGFAFLYRKKTEAYQYTHYKWLDWSEWSDNAVTANDNRQVETQTLYRYKTNDLSNIENTDGVVRTISGKVDTSFAGREADLFIYKYNEASDWTNQYIGQCTIADDGSYSFTFKLRSEPSLLTGDYTATLGIEGTSAVIDISSEYEWLKAPLPKHTVSFYDANGNVISTQNVVEGQNAVIPNVIPELEGYTFVGWSESNINVTEDLIIAPIMKINTYTVTFIDWENQKYEVKTFEHGDTLVTPVIENVEEGYNVSWDAVLEGKNTVTENMVVCTVCEKQEFTVKFYDYYNNVISEQTVKYGESALVPELENVDNITFTNWDNYDFYEVKDNLEVHPVFLYDETVATPTANVDTGVYDTNLTITLSCETDGAKILYTLDGTNPEENGKEYAKPITINDSAELNFVAVKDECNNSETVKKCYALNKADMTSDWMIFDDLPQYVLDDPAYYQLDPRRGYRYKNVVTTTSKTEAQDLRNNDWTEVESTWSDYSEYSKTYPNFPDSEIEVLSRDADPEEVMYYTYSHYKYLDTETGTYKYAYSAKAGYDCEFEQIKIKDSLTTSKFVDGKSAYSYNGADWFSKTETPEMEDPGYDVYSYRTKEYNFYKWTGWSVTKPTADETREYEVNDEVFSFTKPNQYIVTVNFDGTVVEGKMANDQMLVLSGKTLSFDENYFNIEGFTLEGVYTDVDYNNEWNFDTDVVTSNVTLYPKYSVSTFTVKFLDYDNSVISKQEVEYLNYANVPDDPTREGFVFINWECIEGTLTDGVTSNITYIAKYISEEDYTRVSLSRSKFSMITGSSATIKATVMSSNTDSELIWYSSNTDVATVDSLGNITAVHSGTAIITVMALDTYETANCVVTVLGTLDTEILPVSNSGVIVDASAKYLLGINRGENTINSINSKLQNTDLVYTNADNSIVFDNNNTIVGTGCRIQLKDVDEVVDEVTLVIYGDVNGDGAVDAFDAIAVDVSNNTDYELENEYAEAADATGDGEISSADYAYITEIVKCHIK